MSPIQFAPAAIVSTPSSSTRLASAPAAPTAPSIAAARPAGTTPLPADPAGAPARLPSSYYASAQGKKGVELLRALHDIVAQGSTLGYDGAREAMFARIDDPDGTNAITDIYTGAVYTNVAGLHAADGKGLTTEHAWPQSKGATEVAKDDLHHLFPVEGDMNTRRSNWPYGKVDKAEWSTEPVPGIKEVSVLGIDAKGNRVFEPRASVQGDVARAQLYFFTRYYSDRPDDFEIGNFKVSLPTLLEWNRQDPPDAAERARNDAIFGVQHNRNPFVDHPDYADRIDFSEAFDKRR